MNLFVADGEAGCVALFDKKVREGGGDAAGVLDFGVGFAAGKVHGARGVDDEVGSQVGVGFEFFDVKTVRAREGFPVESTGVVAGDILAVFREFD